MKDIGNKLLLFIRQLQKVFRDCEQFFCPNKVPYINPLQHKVYLRDVSGIRNRGSLEFSFSFSSTFVVDKSSASTFASTF